MSKLKKKFSANAEIFQTNKTNPASLSKNISVTYYLHDIYTIRMRATIYGCFN